MPWEGAKFKTIDYICTMFATISNIAQELLSEVTLESLVMLSVLTVLLCIEVCYLYAVYNKVPRYATRCRKGGVAYNSTLPFVSVIVYAHAQDSEALLHLLPRLLSQRYPKYEIIVVNDDTTEELRNAVALYECEYKNVYQTSVPEKVYNVSRKKLGITLGVKAAQGDVIVLTEAHCMPTSDEWLASMARNFVPGIDVVLGYARMAKQAGDRRWGFHFADRVVFGLRYLAYAVIGHPFMGVGANLAYRKETFFANKGFSGNLNLHFGDDDLLVNEIANKRNTRIELSPESIVESSNESNRRSWDELRMKYNFTSKFLHTSSKRVFAFETIVHILLWVTFVATLVMCARRLIVVACALLLFALYWLLTWLVYRRAAKCLGESFHTWLMPFNQLVRPFYSLYYAVVGKSYHKSNYTWQYYR